MRFATQQERACTVWAFVVLVALMRTTTGAVAQDDADLAALSADDLWAQAEQYRSEGDLARAKRLYTFIADHHADNEDRASWALYRLCMLSYNERQIDGALGYIQRVVDQYPDSGVCRNGYAASYLTAIHLIFTKEYDTAIRVGEDQLARFGPQMAPLARIIHEAGERKVGETRKWLCGKHRAVFRRSPRWYRVFRGLSWESCAGGR